MYTRRDWMIGAGAAGVASLLPAAAAQGSDWPQFRGPDRNGISRETGLLRKWPAGGPKVRWSVPVTQGYAAAALVGGRVYHHDYDEAKAEWCVNCRSLVDGKLVWQFREAREIRPNHAITRTVPAVDGRFVCSLDPKAVLHCLDVKTGKQIWRKSLVTEYQATIPSWYNGQNPLQEADRLIVATGGAAIMVALDKATGKEQKITITASSGLGKDEIDRMVKEAERNAEEDRKQREVIDVRNQADSLLYQTEKSLAEVGAKLSEPARSSIEAAQSRLKTAVKGDNVAEIKEATEVLSKAFQQASGEMYAQARPGGENGAGAQGHAGAPEPEAPADEKTVDAEYTVKDEKKK